MMLVFSWAGGCVLAAYPERMRMRCGWLWMFFLVVVWLSGSQTQAGARWIMPSQGATTRPGPRHPDSAEVQPTPPSASRYTLTPEKRAKALAYSHARYVVYFVQVLVSVGIYLLLWRARIALMFRNWGRRASANHVVQYVIFVPLFWAAASLLEFPLEYYSGFLLEHRFDLSTQGLASWLGDWGKTLAVSAVVGIILAWVFYTVVRRSPRHWWLYFWLTSIPIVLVFVVLEPYVIEPLFNNFTPLEKTHPALVERIQAMLGRASLDIPRSRIFLMDASTKTKTVDAYVSGLGASKRVVIWDTTLRKMDSDETLLVLGHETGHYVLHHIPKEIAINELIFLVLFYFGFLGINWAVERWGETTGVEGVGDLASLPIVLLGLTVLVFLASPIINGISRYYEHQADQFGLEVAYGIVSDPNAAEVRSLQVLGEEDLADPDPGPFIKFWLYDHPALDERIRFAATYKPWAEGKPLDLLHPSRR
jgi:Zn-dependent protease with chaperone function